MNCLLPYRLIEYWVFLHAVKRMTLDSRALYRKTIVSVQISLASTWIIIHRRQLLNFFIMWNHHSIKNSTIAVYHLSKAFDTVNHEILMSKLQHNGIRGVMQSWFKSYLSNRKQYVSVKNSSSSMSNITLGVMQAQCWAQYFFFCISVTCIDPQTRSVLFIFRTIQQLLLSTVTLTMFIPRWPVNWWELISGSRPTDFLWTLVKLHI